MIQIDESYRPPALEERTAYGITFAQSRNDCVITPSLLDNVVTKNKALPKEAKRDLTVALIALKYTQSNSVCFAMTGRPLGRCRAAVPHSLHAAGRQQVPTFGGFATMKGAFASLPG